MGTNLLTWLLYDAGNSFLQTAKGGFYLAQWVVLDNGFADIWYGGTAALATIFVLVLSPLLGAWSDKLGKRAPFVRWTTILMYLANIGLVITITSNMEPKARVIGVLLFFLLIQILYQLSLVSYNALLKPLSTKKTRGKIAGLGDVFNNGGWLLGTALLLPFASGKITLLGQSGRSQVFLPALIGFVILTLPMLLLFKEKERIKASQTTAKDVYSKTIRGFKALFKKEKNIGIFLLGFSFVSDAVITIQLYFAIVMDRIYGIADTQKFTMLVIMLVTQILGSYILGILSDKIGTKRVLVYSCLLLIFVFLVGFSGKSVWVLYNVAIFAGLGWSGFYVASKAFLVKISPEKQLGEYFGFYSTFQRFASVIGPLTWGGVTLALSSFPIIKYRAAGFAMVLLIGIGTMLITKVDEKRAVLVS